MPKPVHRSFTLIEMLIVIVIIGILAAALVPRLASVQARARDSKRKTDMRTLYNALEIYYLDNNEYPSDRNPADVGQYQHSYDPQPWMPALSGILTSIPVDPINSHSGVALHPRRTGGFHYEYHHLCETFATHELTARLENTKDPDRNAVQDYAYDCNTRYFSIAVSSYSPSQVYNLSPNVSNQ